MKQSLVLAIALAFASLSAFAQDATPEFADYSAGLAISPFGPSINLTYNVDDKNSISAGFGFSPEVSAPEALLPEFDTFGGFSATGTSSWMGIFWRHRPLENQNFGVNLGMAAGQIQNTLTAGVPFHEGEDPHTFSVNYTENPVMYMGLSYGLKPVKGFQVGVDIGMLSTGGASVEYTGHAEEMEEHEEEIEAQMEDISDNFAWTMLPNIQIGVAYGF